MADENVTPQKTVLRRTLDFIESKDFLLLLSFLGFLGLFTWSTYASLLTQKFADIFSQTLENPSTKAQIIASLKQYLNSPDLTSQVTDITKSYTGSYIGAAVKQYMRMDKIGQPYLFPLYVPAGHTVDVIAAFEDGLPEACVGPWSFNYKVQNAESDPLLYSKGSIAIGKGEGKETSLTPLLEKIRNSSQTIAKRTVDDVFIVSVLPINMGDCREVGVAVIAIITVPIPWPRKS